MKLGLICCIISAFLFLPCVCFADEIKVPDEVYQAAEVAGRVFGVDPVFLLSVFAVESGMNKYTVRDEDLGKDYYYNSFSEACAKVRDLEKKGRMYAVGLGQIVPRHWRVVVPQGFECALLNAYYNAFVTAYILRKIYTSERRSLWRIVARYNAGNKIWKARGYARKVLRTYNLLKEKLGVEVRHDG